MPFAVFRGTVLERLVPVVNLSLASRMPYGQRRPSESDHACPLCGANIAKFSFIINVLDVNG